MRGRCGHATWYNVRRESDVFRRRFWAGSVKPRSGLRRGTLADRDGHQKREERRRYSEEGRVTR